MAAAAMQPRPFDVLLVDDSSRVARDIADAIRAMQQLKFFTLDASQPTWHPELELCGPSGQGEGRCEYDAS